MRIGIIRDSYFTTEPRGLNIARILINAGFEVYVLCNGDKKDVETIDNITLDRFYLNKNIKKKLYALVEVLPIYKYLWAKKIVKFIKKYNIEILQVHDLYMLGPALIANKKFKLPIVANFHENYSVAIQSYNWTKSILGKIVLFLSRWSEKETRYLPYIDRLILLSESFKQELLKKYSFLKSEYIVVYPNVPDINEFNSYTIKQNVIEKNNFFDIFYFGVIAERRGIFTALEALKLIIKNIPARFILIGPVDTPDKKWFNKYLCDNTLKNRVIHYDWKDISELPSYLNIADVCISPILKNDQHDSGVANKIFQYMLYGKPLIVSDSTEQKRIVEEERCGLIHRSNDIQDLSEKIEILYHRENLRQRMGNRGRRAVLNKYHTQIQSKSIIDMYNKLQANLV